MKNEITAKRLSLALSNANMKPQELADKSGVSKSSISQYVNGSHSPSNISSGKMAPILNVNPLWLMGFDVPMMEEMDESTPQPSYYDNPDAREMAQFMFENPEYKVLFDASRKVKKEDIAFVKEMIDRVRGNYDDTGC